MYAGTLVEDTADVAGIKDENLFTYYVLHSRGNGKLTNVTIHELVVRWKSEDEITDEMCDYLLDLYMYFTHRRITDGE